MINRTVLELVDGYRRLIQSQADQPDWPYPGHSYFNSDCACDERWDYWHDARQWADEQDILTAQAFINEVTK